MLPLRNITKFVSVFFWKFKMHWTSHVFDPIKLLTDGCPMHVIFNYSINVFHKFGINMQFIITLFL